MWVEQVEDTVVTGDTSTHEEYADATDEGVYIARSRPTVPSNHHTVRLYESSHGEMGQSDLRVVRIGHTDRLGYAKRKKTLPKKGEA